MKLTSEETELLFHLLHACKTGFVAELNGQIKPDQINIIDPFREKYLREGIALCDKMMSGMQAQATNTTELKAVS